MIANHGACGVENVSGVKRMCGDHMKTSVWLMAMGVFLLMGCGQPHNNVATSSSEVETRIKPVGEVTMAPSSLSTDTAGGTEMSHAASQGNSSQ